MDRTVCIIDGSFHVIFESFQGGRFEISLLYIQLLTHMYQPHITFTLLQGDMTHVSTVTSLPV